MPTFRFNVPPGWPVPPAGWTPPAGWQPDPSWPPAPPGWRWWTADPAIADRGRPVPPVVPGRPPAPLPAPGGIVGGLVNGRKWLEEENAQLRRKLTALLGLDPSAVSAEASRLREQVHRLRVEQAFIESRLAELRGDLVREA